LGFLLQLWKAEGFFSYVATGISLSNLLNFDVLLTAGCAPNGHIQSVTIPDAV